MRRGFTTKTLAALLASALAACATPAPPPAPLFVESASSYAPPPRDKAQVVFLAPADSPAVANGLFEVDGDRRTLLAAIAAHGASIQLLPPGHHVFMAYGRAAELVEADVEGGARYYVLMRPLGSDGLQPVPVQRKDDAAVPLATSNFFDWLSNTQLVDKTAAADAWFAGKDAQVAAAQAAAQSAWQRKSAQERAALTLGKDDAVLR